MSESKKVLSSKYPCRCLEIVGQEYLLSIIPVEYSLNLWQFQLENRKKEALIPAGFKLSILTKIGENLPYNTAVASQPVEKLSVNLLIPPQTDLIWRIEPIPENYHPEILIF